MYHTSFHAWSDTAYSAVPVCGTSMEALSTLLLLQLFDLGSVLFANSSLIFSKINTRIMTLGCSSCV